MTKPGASYIWARVIGSMIDRPVKRVLDVRFDEHSLIVDLMDGRTISSPLAWYPRPLNATHDQRSHWEKFGGGYGFAKTSM